MFSYFLMIENHIICMPFNCQIVSYSHIEFAAVIALMLTKFELILRAGVGERLYTWSGLFVYMTLLD